MASADSAAQTATREIPVIATVTIDHRAYYGRPWDEGFAVVSQDGDLTILDRRLQVVRRVDLGGPVDDFAVSPDGVTWAWIVGGRLWLGGSVGTGRASVALPGDDAACQWQPSGQALWVVNGTGTDVRVAIRLPDGRPARETTVPDKFGGSAVMLRPHPRADTAVLWIAGGEEGQQSWLLHDDGVALRAEHLPADDCRPALFGPDGTWLLAADDDGVTRRSWPDGVEQGVVDWADVDPDAAANGSDAPGDDLVLLPGGFASWNTGNGRLRIIDLLTMSVADEITLAGHPLRTVAEIYPGLTDDAPCGDFDRSVLGADGTVLSVHGERTLVLSALRDWPPAPDRPGS